MTEPDQKAILVVDDDPSLRDMIAMTMEMEGFSVLTAADGQEALSAVERGMPALILLDMKMPVMNGWQFAAEYHSRFDRKAPIVVLTAAHDARERAREVGAVGWIGKPFDLDILINTVRRHTSVP